MSFADDGAVLTIDRLEVVAMTALGLAEGSPRLALEVAHRAQLARHRHRFGFA